MIDSANPDWLLRGAVIADGGEAGRGRVLQQRAGTGLGLGTRQRGAGRGGCGARDGAATMTGLGGSGARLAAPPSTSTSSTTTTTSSWEQCCRCRVAVATAALRRWRPKVFGYAMLVSLLAAHLLPPVWASSRPHPAPSLTPPLQAGGPPPTDDGWGGGGGGGGGRRAGGGGLGQDYRVGRTGSARPPSSPGPHPLPPHPPGGQPPASPNTRSPRQGQCHGWGVQLQRLLLRRSSGSPHPRRQHPSPSSSSNHRHSQHHPNPSLPSLSYSLSPPPSPSLSKSSPTSLHDDIYNNNNNNNKNRGLPEGPLQVVIQQQDGPAPPHPHPHPAPPQAPPVGPQAMYHHRHLYLQLDHPAPHTQRRHIQEPAPDDNDDDGDGDDEDDEDGTSWGLCQETEAQQGEVPALCDCHACPPFNHSRPNNSPSDKCRRATLTRWMMCQACSCGSPQRRLHALLSTQLPFCSQTSLAYLLPCAFLRPATSPLSGQPRHHEPWCDEDCGGGGGEGGGGGAPPPPAPPHEGCLCSKRDCVDRLQRLLTLDQEAEERFLQFKGLLDRYDCHSRYSVKWGCQQCQQWTISKGCSPSKITGGVTGPAINFAGDMVLMKSKERFLANPANKQRFIHLLSQALVKSGFDTLHAQGDADCLIVQTALEKAKETQTVLVGEDTDLILLLLHHITADYHPIFFKSSSAKSASAAKV
ncbi:hypothetical protein ACOMHN_043814 [Nucella lapillus]